MKRICRHKCRGMRGALLGMLLFAGSVAGAASIGAAGEIRREIADPCLRSHWLLIIDPAHPGWPGRLILKESNEGTRNDTAKSPPATVPIAIRAGEQVSVNQSSPILHAQFQAIALQSAPVGQVLKVRLIAGSNKPFDAQGVVISVLAAGVKQADWLAPAGAQQ